MTQLLDRPTSAAPAPGPTRARPSRATVSDPLPAPARPVPELVGGVLRGWLLRHRVSLPIVAGLLALTAWVVGTGAARFPGFADDEGTYVAEAWAFVTHGQLSHYTFWYDHPPLGWIQLGGLTSLLGGLLGGASAVATARSLMVIPALATTGMLYVLGRRLALSRPAAAAAVALLVLCPLGLQGLREVYLENFAVPWMLAAFALVASPSRKLWAFAGAGFCFAIAVLSKETMLLFLPALVLGIGLRVDRRTRSFCFAAFSSAFVLIAVGYPLYAVLKGELLPGPGHVSLEQAVFWQLGGRQSTGSVLSAGSDAHRLVGQWTQVDPWLLGLGMLAGLACLVPLRLRMIGVALLIPVLVALRGGYLPEPFDIGLLPFCALALAGIVDLALRSALNGAGDRRRMRMVGVLARDGGRRLGANASPGWRSTAARTAASSPCESRRCSRRSPSWRRSPPRTGSLPTRTRCPRTDPGPCSRLSAGSSVTCPTGPG